MASRILVVGATGGVGKNVISQLIAHSSSHILRASSRTPEKLSLPSSVEVVKGDLSDPSTFPTLFKDVSKVFLYLQGTDNTADALLESAKTHGVQHIVFLSSNAVTFPNNFIGQLHKRVEDSIRKHNFTYTFLRATVFCTNCINFWAPQIRNNGTIYTAYLNSYSSPIANEDIAAVAVEALTGNKNLENSSPLLTGPATLTQKQQIDIISKVRQEKEGKEVKAIEVTGEQWKASLPPYVPAPVADSVLGLWKSNDGIPQEVSGEVKKITGKSMSYEDWVRAHSSELF